MSLLLLSIWSWILMTVIICQSLQLYYVDKIGIDNDLCNDNNTCGTLYFVSVLIENSSEAEFVINIVDGQNETEIVKYQQLQNTNNWDPCLPKPFSYNKQITIQFAGQTMNDWWPHNICNNNNNNKYSNRYMFDGGNSLNIHNLNIYNYNNSYGLVRTSYIGGASIMCKNCSFQNISSMKPLLDAATSIHLLDNVFIDIHSSFHVMYSSYYFDDTSPPIIFENTSFINVVSESSLLYISAVFNHVENGPLLIIMDCSFENISTEDSIIVDDTILSYIVISDTMFNVTSGSIYHSNHIWQSQIYLNTLRIISNQLKEVNKNGLFYFSSNDIVNVYNINIKYLYNKSSSCQFYMKSLDSALIAPCNQSLCKNPVAVIHNLGQVNIVNAVIDILIVSVESVPGSNHYFELFTYYTSNAALIENKGNMTIKDMFIRKSISWSLLLNAGTLSITNLSFSPFETYNPNSLQSASIIYQEDSRSSLSINASHFIGSFSQLMLTAGTAQVSYSVFEKSGEAVSLAYSDKFIMNDCIIINSGQFNGPCDISDDGSSGAMTITSSSNVILNNNTFSCYDPGGILWIYQSTNISLFGNIFQVNTTQLFYNVSVQKIGFRLTGVVLFTFSSNIKIIYNQFLYNALNTISSWLYFAYNKGINCLHGNTFIIVDMAVFAHSTNITSCLRPQLIESLYIYDNTNDIYGYIDESLLSQGSSIILDMNHSIPPIFGFIESNVALDFLNITINTAYNGDLYPLSVLMNNSKLLLIDSYIMVTDNLKSDIVYQDPLCNVTYNDRLNGNVGTISKMLIECGSMDEINNEYSLKQTMSSVNTNLVNYLSIIKINVTADLHLYYPGEILRFKYAFMDILNNIIEFNTSNAIKINLESFALVWEIIIEENECFICDTGVILSDTSLKHSVGMKYDINVYVDGNMLIPESSTIPLIITGCSVGYGATSNKYQCELCPFGTYNLSPNNTEQCLPCNDNTTQISQCFGFYHNEQLEGFKDEYLYFLLLLLIPLFMIGVIAIYCKRQYDKAFVVNKALVLVIGISQFDDKKSFLPGVKQNVIDLVKLWEDKYNYDVFICNLDTLYSRKMDVIEFIDKYKTRIESNSYHCVIIHIISHALEDLFTCSDGKTLKIDFICHELISAAKYSHNLSLIKLIFNHGCRGIVDYRYNNERCTHVSRASFNVHAAINSPNNKDDISISADSNLVIISGTIKGRTMSDSGEFTKCICDSFGKNLERTIKADFTSLFVEIGNSLEAKTKHAELCNIDGTLRYNPVRFEKCKVKEISIKERVEMSIMNSNDIGVGTHYTLMTDNESD